jgi:hypothetical protein
VLFFAAIFLADANVINSFFIVLFQLWSDYSPVSVTCGGDTTIS